MKYLILLISEGEEKVSNVLLNSKFKILDITAGKRGIWFNKQYPDAIFFDIRNEVHPDVIGDAKDLSRFNDETFDLIVFDPPHVNVSASSEMGKEYGHLTSQQIRDLVYNASREIERVLKNNGILLFKWNDHDQKLDRIMALFPSSLIPLFGQKTATRLKHISSTYWVCYRKVSTNAS